MILYIIGLIVIVWSSLCLEYFLNREYGCIKWAALIFGLPGLLVSMCAAQIQATRANEARLSKINALLDPPIVVCSACSRAIQVTSAFKIDGVCPHCGTRHDPKTVANALSDS